MMRLLILFHRWLGILLCLFFSMWFISGAVLMYHPFPFLSELERLTHSVNIDLSRIAILPLKAVETSGITIPERLRVIDVDGQPAYLIHFDQNSVKVIGAETGEELTPITQEGAKRMASRFLDQSPAEIIGPFDYDQWIVHQRFDAYRPFYRVRFQDPEATVFYVSALTGEVLQRTRSSERGWNYVGAVVHWLYPTILRKHGALWDQVVWLLSFLGVLTVSAGLWLGVVRLRQARRRRRMLGLSPFSDWLRWHHFLGLISGFVVFTWIFSGWLSMDHGRLFSSSMPTPKQVRNFQGVSLRDGVQSFTPQVLHALGDTKEIEFLAVGGKPFVLSKGPEIRRYAQVDFPNLSPFSFTTNELGDAVQQAWRGSSVRQVDEIQPDDHYGHLRGGAFPEQTMRVMLDDPAKTWVHINMKTGTIVSIMDQNRRIYRWLYNGLHSLDFPGLVEKRPLWDIVMLILLALGFLFSLTGVVVGLRKMLQACRFS